MMMYSMDRSDPHTIIGFVADNGPRPTVTGSGYRYAVRDHAVSWAESYRNPKGYSTDKRNAIGINEGTDNPKYIRLSSQNHILTLTLEANRGIHSHDKSLSDKFNSERPTRGIAPNTPGGGLGSPGRSSELLVSARKKKVTQGKNCYFDIFDGALWPIADRSETKKVVEHPYVRETITITSIQNTDGIVQVEEVEKKHVRIIPGPAGEDEDFKSRLWVGATEYVKANGGIVSGCLGDIKTFLKNGKLDQVVAIIKSCSLNALGDLKVTIKDLSGTLAVFSLNLSMHYLNIKKKNMVKVFCKEFIPGNGSGVGGSEMLMEEEEIVKLVEEEEMAYLKLHVCGNIIDQVDLYKFDEEALDLVLKEKARESRAHEEWFEKCIKQVNEDAEHERQILGFHGTI
nr:hypothetical protein [Tanacetum cinerariifolium]